MGTRADFYVGRGADAEWLGSIAWDGYPDGIDERVLKAKTEKTYRKTVQKFLETLDDATLPSQGWPWPWDDSCTTDYSYAFDAKKKRVYASYFGHAWFNPLKSRPKVSEGAKKVVFPNMAAKQNVVLGPRSGLMTVTSGPDGIKVE
jgi:hypothetical protein